LNACNQSFQGFVKRTATGLMQLCSRVWCAKLATPQKYAACDVRTFVKHSLALQHTNFITGIRVSVICSAHENDQTWTCTWNLETFQYIDGFGCYNFYL